MIQELVDLYHNVTCPTLEQVTQVLEGRFPNMVRRSFKSRLIQKANGKPYCWICGYRIYIGEKSPNNHDSFSIDHVTPKFEGGGKHFENLRPAHMICNASRHATRLRPKTWKKLNKMYARLIERMEADGTDPFGTVSRSEGFSS